MELSEILLSFHRLTLIPVRSFRGETLTAAYGLSIFSEAYDRNAVRRLLEGDEHFSYYVTPEALIYGLLYLKNEGEYLILGPVCRESDLHQEVNALASALRCEVTAQLWKQCQQLVLCNLHNFLAGMQTLYAALHRENFCGKESLSYQYSKRMPNANDLRTEIDHLQKEAVERRMLSCVEYGRLDELKEIMKHQMFIAEMPEYCDLGQVRSFQSIFIASTALCARAAVRGGMDYAAAIEVSDRYLERVDKMWRVADIESEMMGMMLYYTEQVAAVRSFAELSPLVKKTAAFIRAHLNEKLTVNAIADTLRQNPAYLSHHFKEQTGESINGYIVKEKLAEAKRRLQATDDSLIGIATDLGFSSQQYFQNVFKKHTGFTPTEYRRMNREEDTK